MSLIEARVWFESQITLVQIFYVFLISTIVAIAYEKIRNSKKERPCKRGENIDTKK